MATPASPSALDAADLRPARPSLRSLVREMIFGVNDGMVSTIGLISGETLSHQPHTAIVIAAVSAAGAATVSMAMGSYLATVSANDLLLREISQQITDIEGQPQKERQEVPDLLRTIGLPHHIIPEATRTIVNDKARWIRFMLREQLGVHQARLEQPLVNAAAMGTAVLIGTLPPLFPFFFPVDTTLARNAAWTLSLLASFAVGFVKGRWAHRHPWRSGLQFAGLTSVSAAVGSLIGYAIATLHG